MTNQIPKTNEKKFDLEERTSEFGINIVKFAKSIHQSAVTTPIITQIVKSGTSVGANYCEADDAESRTDFKHKLGICKKEARETKYWLKIIMTTLPEFSKPAGVLWQEAKELNLIFNAIINKTISNSANRH